MNRITFLLTIGIFTQLSIGTAFAEGPFQDLTYDAAIKAAEKDKKIVVIDFYTTWCGPCKMLDKTTWKDENVIAWFKEKAVGLKIDAEKEKALARKFNINSYPTIILLKPDGKEIDRITGYRNAEQFLSDVSAALSGKDSLSRAKAAAAEAPTDFEARMNYGRELAQRGRNEEALKEFLWCFDEGAKHNIGYTGVRVSFLLGDIVRLGSNYPPALDALRERRDRNQKKVLAHFEKKGDGKAPAKKKGAIGRFLDDFRTSEIDSLCELASDSASINRDLGDEELTIRFYDKLRAIGEEAQPIRQRMLYLIFDNLTDARRYKDIMADGGDPLVQIDRTLEGWSAERAMYKNDENGMEMQAMRRGYIAQKIARNYEVLVGAGEFDDADKAARKLLEFEKSARTYSELIRCAVRARSPELAEELAREAKRDLPEEEREKVVAVDELETDPDDDAPGERTPPKDE